MVLSNALQVLEELQSIENKIKSLETMLKREITDEELQFILKTELLSYLTPRL